MAHECPECAQACYCDQDDLWTEQNDDCRCDCQWARDQGWDVGGRGDDEDEDEPTIDELIDASSLGTPEAKAIRELTPPAVAAAIVEQAMSEAPGYHPPRPSWAKSWRGRVARRLADALAAASRLVGQ